ncbi:hypothetical protein KCMC57_up04600 [Kitasatospora sp. CMC57]|uniref:Uncharacterized protein n=1 Tax=Kitasatospora sp. CMC57 TaxID=3231513 RepID=A0AB33JMN9_9ACTN
MGAVAAIGERTRVAGLALAGVVVLVAERPEEVRRAWAGLPEGAELVILTPDAARAVGRELEEGARPLTVVMPP